ncbi:MAG: 16S rRNA (uracil(1498)-N(3))-methyltransferase [Oligoflexia bacterium]|nr:16S rRNA (uracil(1498)-N(3))-methyltransferase [Oligoflexia bacterium]
MRRFLAPALPGMGQDLELDPDVSHHLLRVTGIAPGELVCIFDGRGGQALAELTGTNQGRARLRQTGPTETTQLAAVVLLIGICKHAAMDTLVRMATELGAGQIQPVITQRSVARGDRSKRWSRIAESSAAQCGRAQLPLVHPVRSLPTALDALAPELPGLVLVPGGEDTAPWSAPLAILVGPEGGLSAAEVALARTHGFRTAGLGTRVLRADTAVAAALARVF